MKTEPKTSSGNRAQAPLPEPFYFQKQSSGTVRKPCGSNLGNIPGTGFWSSIGIIVGTCFGTQSKYMPMELIEIQNAVIPGLPALERWFRKEKTTAWNLGGNSSGNHDGNHGVPTTIPKSGTGRGMGVARGGK